MLTSRRIAYAFDIREIDLAHERRAFVALNAYRKVRRSRNIDDLAGESGIRGDIPRDERHRFGGDTSDRVS